MKIKCGLGYAVVSTLVLCGCGDAGSLGDVGEGDTAGAASLDESVGEVSQALNESAFDRPRAAAITRKSLGDEELWVFACDSNNKMQRKIKTNNYRNPATSEWGSWTPIASWKSCASAPTVGKIARRVVTADSEALGLYWRDLNNHLLEVWFYEDGHTSTTDLSNTLGFGPIQGTPAVSDLSAIDAADDRISIAVVKAGNARELHTIEYYSGSWHIKPVLLAGGGIATSHPGASLVTGFSWYNGRSDISIQINAGAHMIFSRETWSPSYTQYALSTTPNGDPAGVLSLTYIPGSADACPAFGCALIRHPETNRPRWALLDVGGNISEIFGVFDPGQGPGALLGGSIQWSGQSYEPVGSNAFAFDHTRHYVRTSDGHAAEFRYWDGKVVDLGGSSLTSAPVPTVFGSQHYFYTGGASGKLHYHEIENAGQPHVNLNLTTLP